MNRQSLSIDLPAMQRTATARVPDLALRYPQPDAWCALRMANVGRCALWWHSVPKLAGEKLGVIGAFSCQDALAGTVLLRQALRMLHAQGCSIAIGPMNRDTWHDYRFACGPVSEPRFFTEPARDAAGLAAFRNAGFGVCLESVSTISDDLAALDMQCAGLEARFARQGIWLRPLDWRRIASDLAGIHKVACQGFASNPFYTPITAQDFLAEKRSLAEKIDPRHVLIAARGPHIVGFAFIAPDYLELQRKQHSETAIFKTLCILPGKKYRGLGRLLWAHAYDTARDLGYRRAIHALMHNPSRSLEMIAQQSRLLRRYQLFSRRLRE